MHVNKRTKYKVQDEKDRDGGMRSALIVLRDGYRINITFGGEQLPMVDAYETCASESTIVIILVSTSFNHRHRTDK